LILLIKILPTAGTTILDDDEIAIWASQAGRRDTTMETYRASLKQFLKWCMQHKRTFFPASDKTIAHYLKYMSESGYAQSTITGHLAAIKSQYALYASNDPTESLLVQLAKQRAVKEAVPGKEGKYPLLRDDLLKILQLPLVTWRDCRDATLILLQWISMARVGNIVALKVSDIMFQHTTIGNSPCEYIVLRFEKLKNAEGEKLVFIGQGTQSFCAVMWVRAYLKNMKDTFKDSFTDNSPLFFKLSGNALAHLSAGTPSSLLKKKVAAIGLNPAIYASHSNRIGSATEAARLGMRIYAIRRQGLWSDKSTCVYKYLRDISLESKLAITRVLQTGSGVN